MKPAHITLFLVTLFSTAGPSLAQASDFIGEVRIEVRHDLTNNVAPPTGAYVFDFWAQEGASPITVAGVAVAPPAATGLPGISLALAFWPWWSIGDVRFNSGFAGTYAFTFVGATGVLDSATPNYTLGPTGDFANVTSPIGGATNVSLSPAFTWMPITGWPVTSGADIGIEMYDITADLDLPPATLPITATSWTPAVSLVAGHRYQFEIGVGYHVGSSGFTALGDPYWFSQSFSETNSIYFRCTSPLVGTNYCTAAPNSTGSAGVISALGSVVATANNVILSASSLPNSSFGFFLTSTTQGFAMNPGGSSGNLCLGGSIGRYVGPGQVKNSYSFGEFCLLLDLTMTPQPTGFVSITMGQTWNFQAWYRDAVGGVATSNFTDAVEITFL